MFLKKLKMQWLSVIIEINWMFVTVYRKKGNNMINKGVPLTSPKLFSVGKIISKYGNKAIAKQNKFKELYSITNF